MANLNFVRTILQDTARSNRFAVTILPPTRLLIYAPIFLKMRLTAKATQLPGRSFLTTEKKIYGAVDKRPYSPLYDALTMTFIVDKQYDTKRIMDAWYELIYDNNNNIFEYPEDYETTIIIEGLERDNDLVPRYIVQLNNVFPAAIGPIEMSNDSNDQNAEFTVSFQYREWEPLIPLELGTAISAGSLLGAF